MSDPEFLPFRAKLNEYELEAESLFQAAKSGNNEALWAFKWEHPRYRGKGVEEVHPTDLTLDDAQCVTAHKYAFNTWDDLKTFANAIREDASLKQFEDAVELVVAGDVRSLAALLEKHPQLVRARSTRRHRATLLHYVAANGVENGRQTTPPTAVEIAKLLLDSGAEVDAVADMYDVKCTTMSMLLSSCHPANAGLQVPLAETLLDYGAEMIGPGTKWKSSVMTALTFGYLPAAQALVRHGAPIEDISAAAGVGLLTETKQLYPTASALERHSALALAAQLGQTEVVAFLLDQGEDPNCFNPPGMHDHSTPLHQAAYAGHIEVVRLLVTRGARLDLRDKLYSGTPLGWAEHCGQPEIAEFIRQAGGDAMTNRQ